jgi:hypothetical protein|tara:strand:- start:48 stop:224 length:177 start_codon:yes stop_codon:yes gene_type:complete
MKCKVRDRLLRVHESDGDNEEKNQCLADGEAGNSRGVHSFAKECAAAVMHYDIIENEL